MSVSSFRNIPAVKEEFVDFLNFEFGDTKLDMSRVVE